MEIKVTEFVPRKFTGNECKHDYIIKYDKHGNIEVTTCAKCDYEVWG